MKNWLVVCFLLVWSATKAQDTLKIYTWEEAQLLPVDSVKAITASHLKWDSIPESLWNFTHLRYLDLSKNRLKEIPPEIGKLKELRTLDVSKNKLSGAPVFICQLTQLRKLHIARNQYSSLPSCIGYLTHLVVLDIWDNPINSLPDEVMNLKKLQFVDMRSIMLSPGFQQKWLERRPDVTWEFDPPCHCVE
ncbi:MAG: leucine-rich repeat domain-containing protein [Fluviicola sp.]